MQKIKLKEVLMQWIAPCVILAGVIVAIIVNFNNRMEAAIDSVIDGQATNVGDYYCEGIEARLGSVVDVTNAMCSLLESRLDQSTIFRKEAMETVVEDSEAYLSIFCFDDGTGEGTDPFNKRSSDLKNLSYYESLLVTEPTFLYVSDDEITNKAAFVYVLPIVYSEDVTCYFLSYFDADSLKEVFADSTYGDYAFYAIVDTEGTVLHTYGNSATTMLVDNFWNSLRDSADSLGNWVIYDRQVKNGENGVLHAQLGDEHRILCQLPVKQTDFHLVMGLDESYLAESRNAFRTPVATLIIWLSIAIFVTLVVIAFFNIMMQRRNDEHSKALEDKADTDLLTDLTNKMATERKIKEYIESNPNGQGVLFVLDVDNFKKINDTMGHAFGDEVLRKLAVHLQAMFRTSDIVGRTGGDEFMIFLRDLPDRESMERAGRKMEVFFHQFQLGEYVKYSITASIGGAVYPTDGDHFQALYEAADNALYVSKRHGKNRLTFYKRGDEEIEQAAEAKAAKEAEQAEHVEAAIEGENGGNDPA